MYEDLKNEHIIIEIKTLIKTVDQLQEDLDLYRDFMREQLLSLSGNN